MRRGKDDTGSEWLWNLVIATIATSFLIINAKIGTELAATLLTGIEPIVLEYTEADCPQCDGTGLVRCKCPECGGIGLVAEEEAP